MKAMIFAAGKGTRLKSLTENKPKALVKLSGKPMLEHVIQNLISSGVTEIIINVHHYASQIIDFLQSKNNFDVRIEISDETEQLLDTGGGLKKASWFFNDNTDFVLHNTDIICNINLQEMLTFHKQNKAIATLAVRNRESSRYFLFNETSELCGWKNINTKEQVITKEASKLTEQAFSGIHILNPNIFKLLYSKEIFSIVDSYLEISKSHKIVGFNHDNNYWFDIGNPESLHKAEDFLNKKKF